MDLAVAVALAAIYAAGAWIQAKSAALWARGRWLSMAAGASISYVFLDILPELGARHAEFLATRDDRLWFAEQRIYAMALLAFVVIYGLEHMVLPARERRRREPHAPTDWVYVIHVAGCAAYSGLIGLLCVERASKGVVSLILYGAAMALHFCIVDHSLEEAHGHAYASSGRWLLSASVLAGWLAAFAGGLSEGVEHRLFAALAGGVVITSLRGELPSEAKGRFWPFLLGVGGYALLLGLAS